MRAYSWCAALAAFCMGSAAEAQQWIPLQDGKSFAGWKAAENPDSWKVERGAFVSRGERSHLFYVGDVANHDFHNFELSAQVMTSPGANSGIYVHTQWQGPGWPEAGYEMQVINSNPPAEKMGGYVEHKMTGSIYAVRNTWIAPAKDNVWFEYRIRVVGKTIQTFIDGELICEYAEGAEPYRPEDKAKRRLGSGTFALQAHDPGSVVKYKDIKVRLLPADAPPPPGLVPLADPELDQLVTQASNDNIPLIDLGLAPPRGDAVAFLREARRYGLTPGSEFADAALASRPGNVVVVMDDENPPVVELIKEAKALGAKFAFSSGSAGIDAGRLKARLQAIKAAGLGWKDFWVPGK